MTDRPCWKILLIDEDPEVYDLTQEFFSGGCRRAEIVWAHQRAAAVQALQEGRFDAALVGDNVEGHSGLEIVQKAGPVPFPVILFTQAIRTEYSEKVLLESGVDFYVSQQEVTPDLLVHLVDNLIDGKRLRLQLQQARLSAGVQRLVYRRTAVNDLPSAGCECALWEIELDPSRPDVCCEDLFISPQIGEITGLGVDEYPDTLDSWLERIHPQDAPLITRQFDDLIFGQREALDVELRVRHKDGSWRWLACTAKLICDAQGRPLRVSGAVRDISHQKASQKEQERLLSQLTEALRVQSRLLTENQRQRALVEQLLEIAPLGICFLEGPEHRLTLCNPAFISYGLHHSPVLGRPAAEVWPELAPELIPILDHVYTSGQSFRSIDLPLQMPGWPEERFFTLSFSLIPGDQDQPAGILAVIEDCSEQVLVRKNAMAERDLLQALIQSIQDEIWFCDLQGNLSALNPAAAAASGILNPMGAKTLHELVDQIEVRRDDGNPRPESEPPLLLALQGKTLQGEEHIRIPDTGEWKVRQYSAAPVRRYSGEILGAVMLARDITVQKQAAQAMQEAHAALSAANISLQAAHAALCKSESRLRRLVDSNIFGVMYVDLHGRISGANQALLEVLNCTHADLEDDNLRWDDLIPEEYREIDRQARSEADLRGGCKPREIEILLRDGQRLPVMVGYALLDETPTVYACFLLDMTEMRRAQRTLQQYAERLEHSNRDLREFALVASHDLQEPLRKVEMFTRLLEKRLAEKLDAEDRELLQRTQDAAARMKRMINDLLSLSEVSKSEQPFVTVDLNEIASGVLSDLEVRIKRSGGQVIVEPLPRVCGDPVQMHQLLQNLIGNALKFKHPDRPPVVHVYARVIPGSGSNPAHVEINVKDNGIGFDMKDADRIFQPFRRLHERSRFEGSGMGLPICRRIVERHHGSLQVYSEPGVGTMFTVILPLPPQDHTPDLAPPHLHTPV